MSTMTHPARPSPKSLRPHWLETLLFLAIASGPPAFRGREATASLRSELDLANLIEIAVWSLGLGWVVWHVLAQRGKVPRLAWPHVLGLALAYVLGVSALVSPAPPLTLFKALQIGIAVLFTLFWTYKFGWQQTLTWLSAALVLLLLGTYLAAFVAPETVIKNVNRANFGLVGQWLAPTAPLALCVLAFTLTRPIKASSLFSFIITLLALVLLVLSRRRTGFIALGAFGLLAVFTASRKWSPIWKYVSGAALLLLTASLVVGWEAVFEWVVRNPDQIGSLSSRTPLWQYLLAQVFEQSPVYGLGYYASSRVLGPQAVPGLGNAHSAFVEVLLGGGLIAFVCYVAIWLWVLGESFASIGRWDRSDLTMIGCLMVAFFYALITIHTIDATIVSFTFWLVVACWVRKKRVAPLSDLKTPA